MGSALGGMARYLAVNGVYRLWPHHLPFGTIAVNVTGCLLMGLLAGWRTPEGEPWLKPDLREFLLTGVLGGYTTFSAFSLQTLALMREGHHQAAAANVLLSVGLCLGAVAFGYAVSSGLRS
ncbi:MAG TPA: fluoride efflux transporter CrcB [Verrucomicrobiales bacterium]|nr:fluoride efflux transporter CrcB [Verrucomicrobiales bacterium]